MTFKGVINILLLVMLLAAGCSSDVEDRNQQASNSAFTVDMISSVELADEQGSGIWGLKNSKIVNIKACLKDRALGQAVIDQPFLISGGVQGEIKAVTDISGCLFWEEQFEFNYLADESYLLFERKISSVGNYSGYEILKLALNPWSASPIIDARDGKQTVTSFLRESEQMSSSLTIREKSNLLLDDVAVSFIGDSVDFSGTPQVKLKLELVPKLVRVGLQGNIIHESLTKGLFAVKLRLLEREHGSEQRITLAKYQGELVISKGSLQGEVTMELERSFNHNSIIELLIEMVPLHGPEGLTSEQGLLLISLDSGKSSGKLHSISKDEVTTIKSVDLESRDREGSKQLDVLTLDIVKIHPGVFEDNSNKGVVRRRMATINICLKESISPRVLNDQDFTVTLLDSNQQVVDQSVQSVDLNGCIEYRPWISFNYTHARKWYRYHLQLSGKGGLYNGIEQKRDIYINPWQNDDSFGIDGTVGKPPQGQEDETRIIIDKISYSHLGNARDKFDLDKFLNLALTKRYEITFSPQLENFNFSKGEKELTSLTFGKYKLRVLILSPKRTNSDQIYSTLQDFNIEDYIVLSGSEVPVTIGANGLIQKTLSFPLWFSELSMLILKNKLLVELVPDDTDSNILPAAVLARFQGSSNALTGMTQKIDLAKESIINFSYNLSKEVTERLKLSRVRHQMQNNLPSTLELFHQELSRLDDLAEATHRTEFINIFELNQQYGINFTESNLKGFVKRKDNKELKELCSIFYRKPGSFLMGNGVTYGWSSGSKLLRCQRNPLLYLEIHKSEHVEEIKSTPVIVPELSHQSTLNVTDGFFIASTHAQMKSSLQWNAVQTEFGLGLSKFIGIGPSVSVYNTHVAQEGNEERLMDMRRYSTNITSNLLYESLGLSFQAAVQKCLLVSDRMPHIKKNKQSWLSKIIVGEEDKPRWWVNGKLVNERPQSKKLHICLDTPVEERVDEEWFFVMAEEQKSKQLLDRSEAELNEFTFTIRGNNKFERLRDFFQAKEGLKIIRSVKDIELVDRYQKMLDRGSVFEFNELSLDGSVPGLLTR
ncbi:MAG: hypothetical protein HN353_11020 [Bdellovibrionales bacterium]|jgi:hypothetical protein|nr:hypothetical protein [Bdellovibrionales bacterium]MBT3525201.1 hypothetical protein [Bdellovibrionales bacterium]MBT7668666.1 hypothetical protein [Bdellovibrionales bacterium]MBT7766542.1 hypothetical protein [Bdellovibrionales bacterium]